MPFQSKKAKLQLSETDRGLLQRISNARTEEYRRVERARILLHFEEGLSIPKLQQHLVRRCPRLFAVWTKRLQMLWSQP